MNIRFESSVSGTTLEEVSGKFIKEFPLSKIANIVKKDIQDNTVTRGWKRIKKTVKSRKVDDKTYEIYLGGDDSDISGYLQSGTRDHLILPVNRKALAWGGTPKHRLFFSKGHMVKGIKATNFFKVSDEAINKIAKETSDFIRRIFS